jgi:glycosyltransferase involved in cell wall biosynthesis
MYRSEGKTLKIGYLMQNGAPDLSQVSGPQLHISAVIRGFLKLGHIVRIVGIQKNRLVCSDDLAIWHSPEPRFTNHKLFRMFESLVRRIQYELNLPFLGIFDSLHYADACLRYYRGFDILYERHGYMGFGGVLAARLLKIPLVLELNGNIIREIDERGLKITAIQRKIGIWVTIQTIIMADRIVVVSEALEQVLVRDYRVPKNKIDIVINGVDIDLFSQEYDDKLVRSQYGISPGPIIAFVGSFEPWHGVDFLVSSFKYVKKAHIDAQLVIVGDGSGKEKAIELASNLGLDDSIRFLGRLPQDQVAAVIKASQVLVAPYPFETGEFVGTPLKIMEYMAAGKGIVASTAPIHEIIQHNVNGWRVAPAQELELANGILKLLENANLCAFLGNNALQQAQKYSWDSVSLKLAELFIKEIQKKTGTKDYISGNALFRNE